MSPGKTQLDRLATKVGSELDDSSSRLADRLKGDFVGGDAQDVPKSQWHDIIRSNWGDPQWRALQAFRMGPVRFVQDAMDAFGTPRSALKQQAQNPNMLPPVSGQDIQQALAQTPAPTPNPTSPQGA